MPESLRADFISYPDMLIQSFEDINSKLEYTVYDATQDHFPEDINECDAYITTGSRHSVNDGYAWIAELEEFVRKCQKQEKKLVGICFGHQLLARALGGEVKKSEAGPGLGVIENQLLQHESWIKPHKAQFNMIVSHEDQVLQMPEGAILLASNAHCKNFMIQFDENFMGIQGHPEFNNDFSRGLMTARAEHISDNILKSAYDSLSKFPDNPLVMKWITHFLSTNTSKNK
jgi:GMP synthase-like glutamine amidotransferase